MSLQVWLLLNGNLNNYGLSNYTLHTLPSGASWSAGKLGNNLNISNAGTTATINQISGLSTFSISFWYKFATGQTFTTYSDLINISMTSANKGNFRIEVSNNNGTTTNWYGHNLTDGGMGLYTTTPGVWYHDAIVVDGTNLKRYVNGALVSEKTVSIAYTTSSFKLGDVGMYCQLADVRVYDHALSPKEVKEISKGLVCHYPLDNNGSGMPNYFVNSNFATGSTANWYSVNSSSIRIETKDGYKCITGTKGTTNNICGQTINTYNYVANSKVTFTVSADVYVETTGTFGIGNWISTTEASGWQGMSGQMRSNTSMDLKVGWNHVSATRVDGYNQYNGKIITAFSYNGTTYWMTNVKFEFGDIETPWCPNSEDTSYLIFNINENKEIDISGYKHDGTAITKALVTSDTPRYTCSYIFNGVVNNAIINSTTDFNYTDNFSWACWIKTNYTGTTAQYAWTVGRADAGGYGYGLRCASTTTCDIRFGNKSYSIAVTGGSWTHLAFTKNGTAIKIYKNGELANSYTFDGTLPTYSDGAGVGIGCFHYASGNIYPYYGSISDFRIYATALNADDIKQLYQVSASIDNNGNVFCSDIQEV